MEMPRLTHLELACDGVDLTLSALQSFLAVNLLSLKLRDTFKPVEQDRNHTDSNPPIPIRMFPRLARLDISNFSFCLLMRIIAILECPSMRHLGVALVNRKRCNGLEFCDIGSDKVALSVTSLAIRSYLQRAKEENMEKIMRHIVSSLRMPYLKRLQLGMFRLTVEQYRSLTKIFGDIEVATFLCPGFDRYRLSLTHKG
jgi:hypothetical protein